VFRHELPGAGGWGDPLTRSLDAVAIDLREGKISFEGAARDYGVVAAGHPPVIDSAATAALRQKLKAERAPTPSPAWEPLHAAAPAPETTSGQGI
jgi:N-methylhydantoinase B